MNKNMFLQTHSQEFDSDEEKREREEMKNLITDELRKRRGGKKEVNYYAGESSMLKEGSSRRIKGLDVSAREHVLNKLSNELQVPSIDE